MDKQVNAQKEKNFRGSRNCKLLQAHEKVCDEMKQTRKNDVSIKILLKEAKEALYNAHTKYW